MSGLASWAGVRAVRPGTWWSIAAMTLHLAFLFWVAAATDWNFLPFIEAHDGVYYLSHLDDPLLTSPPEWWDNIVYRGVRLGYVLLALPFRWMGGISALVIVNLIGVVVGLHAVRKIARRHGASTRVAGLVWIFNPGALVSTALFLPDTVAWAAILLALVAVDDARWGRATLFSILAVVTKEASIAALVVPAAMKWNRGKKQAVVPVATAGFLHVLLLAVLMNRFGASFHGAFVTWPITGWTGALPLWLEGHQLDGLAAALTLVGGVAVILVWWRNRSFYLAAAVGQAVLMFLLAPVVLAPMANTARIAGLFWPLLAATRSAEAPPRDENLSREGSDVDTHGR